MGAIIAILGDVNETTVREDLARMIGRSSYRGQGEQRIEKGIAIAAMTLGWDASLGSWNDWLVAFHGYVGNWSELALRFSFDLRPEQSIAERLGCAYESIGDPLFKALRGEFAVLLYSRRSRCLRALTSPLGTRTLFFRQVKDGIRIATEVRQLLAGSDERPSLNEEALVDEILNRPSATGKTVYREVLRVLPSRIYQFRDVPGTPDVKAYWEPPDTEYEAARPIEDYVEELRQHLSFAVRRALPPGRYGLGLSGGLDSGAILATLASDARESHSVTEACTIASVVFPGLECDESERIRSSLRWTGTTAEIVDGKYLASEWMEQDLEALDLTTGPGVHDFKTITEPLVEGGLGVLLMGVGGDEWLTGTVRYLADEARSFRMLSALGDGIRLWRRSGLTILRFIWRNVIALERPLLRQQRVMYPDWLRSEWRDSEQRSDDASGGHGEKKEVGRGRAFVLRNLRLAQLLDLHPQIEQFVANQGIELRYPFMDLDLVEFGFRVPSRILIAGQGRKGLMRRAMTDLLPPEVIYGPKVSRDCLSVRDAAETQYPATDTWSLVRRGILSRDGLDRLRASRWADAAASVRLFELWWFESFSRRFKDA